MRGEKEKRSQVEISGIEQEKRRIPNWFGEAVWLGKYWLESGLVARSMWPVPRSVSCNTNNPKL